MSASDVVGPLAGVRVVELAGIGPVPFAAMVLADLGADVVRVDRVGATPLITPEYDVTSRSRRAIALDLKSGEGRGIALDLIASADIVLEGLRPGVVERLGLGPERCRERNPALVYGRMTGWGQDGPYAQMAGHDLTYLAVSGALHPLGYADRPPVPPLNVVGDFGGGSMYLALGVLAALTRARATGEGDVVDAAILDGVASLNAMMWGWRSEGAWADRRESNMLDGGAPFYRVYRCADGLDIAVGAIEPQFWAILLDRIGLSDEPLMKERDDRGQWPAVRARMAEHFAGRPRSHWVERTAGTDACLAPVLSMHDCRADEHVRTRGVFVEVDGVTHPVPAPRFARAGERAPQRAPRPGEHSAQVLAELGRTAEDIGTLQRSGVVG